MEKTSHHHRKRADALVFDGGGGVVMEDISHHHRKRADALAFDGGGPWKTTTTLDNERMLVFEGDGKC